MTSSSCLGCDSIFVLFAALARRVHFVLFVASWKRGSACSRTCVFPGLARLPRARVGNGIQWLVLSEAQMQNSLTERRAQPRLHYPVVMGISALVAALSQQSQPVARLGRTVTPCGQGRSTCNTEVAVISSSTSTAQQV